MKKLIILGLIFTLVSGCFFENKVCDCPKYDFLEESLNINVNEEISLMYDQIKESVVAIKAFDSNYTNPQKGSGFVFLEKNNYAYLITNEHVINNKDENIEVVFDNKKRVAAELYYGCSTEDIAIIKIPKGNYYTVASFGNSSELKRGEDIFSVGSPINLQFANSVSKGVISSLDVHQTINGNDLFFIKTDAPLNPGNSGGPLLNLQGEVVGVNTLRQVSSKGEDVQFINFAIPINFVDLIIDSIFEEGSFQRPELGVNYSDLDSILKISLNRRESLNIDSSIYKGVFIRNETSGVFANENLDKNRIIKKVNGNEITSKNILYQILIQSKGKTITIESVDVLNEDHKIHEVEIN